MAANNGSNITLSKYWGKSKTEVRRKENGTIVVLTHNSVIVVLAIVEALIVGTLMAMNYLFRYNSTIRYNNDMVDYSRVLLSCDLTELQNEFSRPYFDYNVNDTKSFEGLQLKYELPEWVFFLCTLVTPIVIILIIEGFRALFPGRVRREIKSFGFIFPQPLRRLVRVIGCYLLGVSIAGLFASIFKYNIASPRPHFMSVCFPDSDIFEYPPSCSNETLWKPSIDCTNDAKEDVVEALKSFPSYHAAVAVYSVVFTSAYLIYGAKVRGVYSLQLLVILGLTTMALIGATHRLSSGYSFSRDVIGGAIIGLVVAYWTVNFLVNKFKDKNIRIIKEFVQATKENLRKERKAASNHSESDNDSDFGSDFSTDDLDKYIMQLNAFSLIPRAKADMKNQPIQAVNPAMDVNESVQTSSSRLSPNASSSKPANESPMDPAVRSSSSINRQKYPESLQMQPYNVPQQRNSASMNSLQGYTNYGFSADKRQETKHGSPSDRQHPRGVLSAYYPSGAEASSHF